MTSSTPQHGCTDSFNADSANSSKSKFYCATCSMTFSNPQNLRRHYQSIRHRNKKKNGFSSSVEDQSKLDSYQQQTNVNKSTENLVSNGRDNRKVLATTQNTQELRPYKCTLCNKSYTRNYHLRRHIIRAHALHRGLFKCFSCSKVLRNSCEFKKHHCKSSKKRIQSKPIIPRHDATSTDLDLRSFKCSICDEAFQKEAYLKIHCEVHHSLEKISQTYQCSKCNKSFVELYEFEVHNDVWHAEICTQFQYLCKKCNALFDRKSDVEAHLFCCVLFHPAKSNSSSDVEDTIENAK